MLSEKFRTSIRSEGRRDGLDSNRRISWRRVSRLCRTEDRIEPPVGLLVKGLAVIMPDEIHR